MKNTREAYRAGGVMGVLKMTREAWREAGGTLEFLRAAKKVAILWVMVAWGGVNYGFGPTWGFLLLAVLTSTVQEWSASWLRRMLKGYGQITDRQQAMIYAHHAEHLHPSERSAKARAARLN